MSYSYELHEIRFYNFIIYVFGYSRIKEIRYVHNFKLPYTDTNLQSIKQSFYKILKSIIKVNETVISPNKNAEKVSVIRAMSSYVYMFVCERSPSFISGAVFSNMSSFVTSSTLTKELSLTHFWKTSCLLKSEFRN